MRGLAESGANVAIETILNQSCESVVDRALKLLKAY